jgi:glutathione S-transferase
MSLPKLSYFDFSGSRGEECRLAFRLAGVEFEDDRIKPSNWADHKSETPFGAMPVLTIEGKGRLSQSNAILVYLGRLHGLHPSDAWEAARHEQFLCAAEELRSKAAPVLRISGEDRQEAREELASGLLTTWGAQIEALLGDGPFVGGSDPSVTDIKLYMIVRWFSTGIVDHVPTDVFAGYPKLMALYEGVRAIPSLAEWTRG